MYEGLGGSWGTQVECTPKQAMSYRKPTTRERLLEQRKELERILGDVNAAIEALDKNPEFEEVHNLLTKVL